MAPIDKPFAFYNIMKSIAFGLTPASGAGDGRKSELNSFLDKIDSKSVAVGFHPFILRNFVRTWTRENSLSPSSQKTFQEEKTITKK